MRYRDVLRGSGQNAFQVGTVLNQDYHSDGRATNHGPVVANAFTVAGNPRSLPFRTPPAGAPTTSTTVTTSITSGKPYNWNG
jgi:hypothetical protein